MGLTHKLENWFSNLSPIHIDIVGDFAGNELFIIEGDSLLRLAFSDERIDMSDGLQVLHAVYVIERFLQNLKSRGCCFHITFFDCHKNLCIPEHADLDNGYKYLLTRACIIYHLRQHSANAVTSGQNNAGFQIHQFQGPTAPNFVLYLKAIRPYFILTHDGSTLEKRKDGNFSRVTLQKGIFLGFILHAMLMNYTIGLIHEVDFQNSKVFTLIIPAANIAITNANLADPAGLSHLYELLYHALHTPASGSELEFEEKHLREVESEAMKLDINASTSLHLRSLAILSQQESARNIHQFIPLFILHLTLKQLLRLSQRRVGQFVLTRKSELEANEFMRLLALCQLKLLNNVDYLESLVRATSRGDGGFADHIDGRLWKHLLGAWFSDSLGRTTLPTEIWAYYSSLVEVFRQYGGLDVPHLGLKDSWTSTFAGNTLDKERMEHRHPDLPLDNLSGAHLAVLPFSNPVFDKHLSCIRLAVDTQINTEALPMSPFEKALYETHWHSTRRLDDMRTKGDKLIPIARKPKWWQLKGNQVARAKMLRYAKNLAGGEFNPEIIILQNVSGKAARNPGSGAPNTPERRSNKASDRLKTSKSGTAHISKADQIRAANERNVSMKNSLKAAAVWKTFYRDVCLPCKTKRGAVVALSSFIAKSKEESVTIEARLFKCCLLFEIWKDEYCTSEESKSRGYNVVALIFQEAQLMISSPKLSLTIKHSLDTIFTALGFAPLPSPNPFPTAGKGPLTLSPPVPSKSSVDARVGNNLGLLEFQLQYCGPYMERNLDAQDDPRVRFKPDAWQIKVLDALDEDKSVFVVAPTSAGKTFIAYYAMERVLRTDNEGVLVYVAPTKALVNQIAAELQSRFDKNYKDGHTVWAIHTRDYRVNNPQKCQILVTVPHILQIMLLSPALASSWSPRVKRIILDEVHCIGQSEDGVIWEQILLLAPCPLIALSATVGNPAQFHRWLQITQSSLVQQKQGKSLGEITHGIEVEMIHHRYRYNDLRKFFYNTTITPGSNFIKQGTTFRGLDTVQTGASIGVTNLEDIPRFQFIHPIAALSESDINLPDDLILESRDCYMLWRAMVKVQTGKYLVPKDLEPTSTRFPEIIKKIDVIKWEEALKSVLRAWMRDRDSPMPKLLQLLRGNNKPSYYIQAADDLSDDDDPDDRSELEENMGNKSRGSKHSPPRCPQTLQLLSDLHKLNALPALLFSYNRGLCDLLCADLVQTLEVGEAHYRQTNPEWKRKVAEKEAFEKAKKKVKAPKKVAAEDLTDPRDVPDAPSVSSFDPKEPIPEFTFASADKCSKEELRKEVQELTRAEIPQICVRALRRGIGIHHAGISRVLRECVERLFRKGFLRVVIATGTLSLGINMPCATVVFVTDDVYLTPLNYRQASGRAGRRGFDLLGNVVFHRIPLSRTYRLINSHLPSLTGHFPTSTTLILRLFILLHGSENSDHAVSSINSLLSQNRISVGLGDISFKEQVLHHVRFSIEYLRRTNLLSASGVPINFASCVSNLYYAEPGNFMLNALLRAGVFHEICKRFSSARLGDKESDFVMETVNKQLILILAHFFGRQPFKKGSDLEELLQSRSSSTVVLEDLPQEALEVIRAHNRLTLDIFITYVKTFAAQHRATVPDDTLPFTGVKFSPMSLSTSIGLVGLSQFQCSARSSFVALSGHSDTFVSLDDLLTSCRGDILLESSGIPYIPVDDNTKLNAYLYDFFLHGSIAELAKANRISRSDVWFMLNDFSMILATIVTCLKNLISYGPEGDMKLLSDEDQDCEGVGDLLEAKRDVMAGDEEEIGPKDTSSRAMQRPIVKDWDNNDDSGNSECSDDTDFSEYDMDEGSGGNERESLLKVLKGFVGLQKAFNEKFTAIFATKSDRDRKAASKRKRRPNVRI